MKYTGRIVSGEQGKYLVELSIGNNQSLVVDITEIAEKYGIIASSTIPLVIIRPPNDHVAVTVTNENGIYYGVSLFFTLEGKLVECKPNRRSRNSVVSKT